MTQEQKLEYQEELRKFKKVASTVSLVVRISLVVWAYSMLAQAAYKAWF